MLALRGFSLETPAIAQWLKVLAEIIQEHAMSEVGRLSAMAAEIVAAIRSQEGVDLLPGNSPWLRRPRDERAERAARSLND